MNTREEFIRHTIGLEVKCVYIAHDTVEFILPVGYTAEDREKFLSELDFDYDEGYGTQELHGYIWYTDGTWSDRFEYDGSEWWKHRVCPTIPERLTNENE